MGVNSETPEPQNTENRVTEREKKRQRDPNECNSSMKMEFSPEQKANAVSFVAAVKDRFSNQPDKYQNFVEAMSEIMRNGMPEDVESRIKTILQGQNDLMDRFSAFLPSRSTPAIVIADKDVLDDLRKEFSKLAPDVPVIPKEEVYSVGSVERQGILFCQEVQRTLIRIEDYLAFLKLFHCYSREQTDEKGGDEKITKEQLEERVVRLIGNHPALIDEFHLFLNHCENFHQIEGEKAERRFERLKLDEQRKDRDWNKEGDNTVNRNLSKDQNYSPSCQLLPKGHQQVPPTTGRTTHKSGLLNICWEAVPETRSNNCERDRNHDSLQDLWEDDKYEIDMLLGWFHSARKFGEKLMEKLKKDTPSDETIEEGEILVDRIVGQEEIPEDEIEEGEILEDRIVGQEEIPEDNIEEGEILEDRIVGQEEIPDDKIEIQGRVSGDKIKGEGKIPDDNIKGQGKKVEDEIEGKELHFRRCVERLYGDHSTEVFWMFDLNRRGALPVIVDRLKQKEQQLRQFNKEFDKL